MTAREIGIAFSLGIAFAAPPGIVTAESIRRGLAGGFWQAAFVGFGSLIGDAVYAVLALLGLAGFLQYGPAHRMVGFVGACVLVYLGVAGWRSRDAQPQVTVSARRGAFAAGAMLSLANPFAAAFWLGFGGALLSAGIQEPSRRMPSLLAVFLGASAVWVFVLSGLIAAGRRFVGPSLFRTVSIASAVIFVSTGLYTFWQSCVR